MYSASHFALVTLLTDTSRWHPALRLLVEGRAYALASRQPVGKFGVKVLELQNVGITEKPIRLLLESKFVQPANGAKHSPAKARNGRRGKTAFRQATPLVLSDAGIGIARDVYLRLVEFKTVPDIAGELYTHLVALGELPRWDGSRRELWFHGELAKKFSVLAKCRELILTGFEEIRWRHHLYNPLPPQEPRGPALSKCLREAIHGLNSALGASPMRFCADDLGEGVCWQC